MHPLTDDVICEAVRLEIIHQGMFVIFSKEDAGEPDLSRMLEVIHLRHSGGSDPILMFTDLKASEAMIRVYGKQVRPVLMSNINHRWTIQTDYGETRTTFFQYHRNAELMPGSAVIRILAFQFLLAIMNYYFHTEDEEQKPSWFFGEWKHTMDQGD